MQNEIERQPSMPTFPKTKVAQLSPEMSEVVYKEVVDLYKERPTLTYEEGAEIILSRHPEWGLRPNHVLYRVNKARKEGDIPPSPRMAKGVKRSTSLKDALTELEDAKANLATAETRYQAALQDAEEALKRDLPEELRKRLSSMFVPNRSVK